MARRWLISGAAVALVAAVFFLFTRIQGRPELVQALSSAGTVIAAFAAAVAAVAAWQAAAASDASAKRAAQALGHALKPAIDVSIRNEPFGEGGALVGNAVVINRSPHDASNVEVEVQFRGSRGTRRDSTSYLPAFDQTDATIWHMNLGPELSAEECNVWVGVHRIVARYSDAQGLCRWERIETWPRERDPDYAAGGRTVTERAIP